jgi:hypothetical protein
VTGPRDTPSEDAAWREIVDNYGDPVLDPEEPPPVVELREPAHPEPPELAGEPWQEDRFVPPTPPPLPRVPKDRLAAWLGVFVAPVLLLVATVLRVPLPTIVVWLLIAAFLGGFGYLVAQMPRGPRDPFDDGARI